MQLYAFDDDGKLTCVSAAAKQCNYRCPECQGAVRRRGGLHRQDHFFHVEQERPCRQSHKSLEHLNVQYYFLKMLPEGECLLENPFPAIGRIADVYWPKEKMVFEVQCSCIAAKEVMERNRDYNSLGLQAVWILHDDRYNGTKLSSMEWALHESAHYFTNISKQGAGIIYDQFSILHQGKRLWKLSPLAIDVAKPKTGNIERSLDLKLERMRQVKWQVRFTGDLADCDAAYCEKAKSMESRFYSNREGSWEKVKQGIFKIFMRPYQLLLQMMIEKYCK